MTNFKVGDKVKITGNTNWSVNEVGDIGVISSDVDYGLYGLYRFSVNGRGSVSNRTLPSEMKLVTTSNNVPIGYLGLLKDMNLKDGDEVKGVFSGDTYKVTGGEVGERSILRCKGKYTLVSRASEWTLTDTPDYTTHDVATHNGMPVAARKKAPVVKTIGVRMYAASGFLKDATVFTTDGVPDWSTLTVD
jgi:hypothetical protein